MTTSPDSSWGCNVGMASSSCSAERCLRNLAGWRSKVECRRWSVGCRQGLGRRLEAELLEHSPLGLGPFDQRGQLVRVESLVVVGDREQRLPERHLAGDAERKPLEL